MDKCLLSVILLLHTCGNAVYSSSVVLSVCAPLTELCSCIISDALSSQITVKYTPEMSSQMQTTWKRNCCPDSATFDLRPDENLKITEGGL